MVAGSGLRLGGLTASQRHPADPRQSAVPRSREAGEQPHQELDESGLTEAEAFTQTAKKTSSSGYPTEFVIGTEPKGNMRIVSPSTPANVRPISLSLSLVNGADKLRR